MNRAIRVLLVVLAAAGLSGCFETKFNFDDPAAMDRMTLSMTMKEKGEFFNDVELVAAALGGLRRVNGLTAAEIKEQAANVRENRRKADIAFLKKKISDMERDGKLTTLIGHNRIGGLADPAEGKIGKEHALGSLRNMLQQLGGDDQRVAPASMPKPTEPMVATGSAKQSDGSTLARERTSEADGEYAAKWKAIQADSDAYLKQCQKDEVALTAKLDGTAARDGQKEAKAKCSEQLAALTACMAEPSATVGLCFQDILESGD